MSEVAEVPAREASLQQEVERLRGELARAEAAIEAARRTRQAFVRHMNHGVRTPLNAILGYVEMLVGEGLTASQRELVSGLQENGDRLGHLLETMLALTHVESGSPRPGRRPFVPATAIDRAFAGVAGFAARNGVRQRLVGRELADVAVVGDGTWVQWIVGSLLHNAIKFGGAGEVVVGVRQSGVAGTSCSVGTSRRFYRSAIPSDDGVGRQERRVV